MDATMVMGLRVLVRFTARSVIFTSFSMFIIISDMLRCLVVLNDSPLLHYHNNGIASCQERENNHQLKSADGRQTNCLGIPRMMEKDNRQYTQG